MCLMSVVSSGISTNGEEEGGTEEEYRVVKEQSRTLGLCPEPQDF